MGGVPEDEQNLNPNGFAEAESGDTEIESAAAASTAVEGAGDTSAGAEASGVEGEENSSASTTSTTTDASEEDADDGTSGPSDEAQASDDDPSDTADSDTAIPTSTEDGGDETSGTSSESDDSTEHETAGDSDSDSGPGDTSDVPSCQGLDLLFVVDTRSASNNHHQAMIMAMPDLIEGLIEALPSGIEVRLGLTTAEMGNTGNAVSMNCESPTADQHYITIEDQNTGRPGTQGRMLPYFGQSRTTFDTADGIEGAEPSLTWLTGLLGSVGEGTEAPMPAAAAGWSAHAGNEATNEDFMRDEDTVFGLFVSMSSADDYTPSAVGGKAMFDMLAQRKSGCGGGACMLGAGVLNTTCFDDDPIGELMGLMSGPAFIGSNGNVMGQDPSEYRKIFEQFSLGLGDLCRNLP